MNITIIGAGIIGATIAHALLDDGHNVTIIDREGPVAGTSQGNAGWIAHTDILPLASPKTLRRVPKFLLDPLGPLTIRPSYALKVLPWFVRLLAACRPEAVERSTLALIALQGGAVVAWSALSEKLGLQRHLHQRGGLYVYRDPAGFAAEKALAARQNAVGIRVDMIGPDDLRQLEPALRPGFVGAAFHPDTLHVSDPRDLTRAVFDAALARGATFEIASAQGLAFDEASARILCADGHTIAADQVIVAAGVWSKALAASLGDKIPLESERGYNVSFPGSQGLTSRPIGFPMAGFVVTPLDSGLRIGGAVEFAGLHAAPNHARTCALYDRAGQLIEGLPAFESGTLWMGHRPSLPDSLPVIGAARASRRIVYACGHGHYGLTQSATTARHVADLIAGRTPAISLDPFRVQRF